MHRPAGNWCAAICTENRFPHDRALSSFESKSGYWLAAGQGILLRVGN
jgi:hypothetical protein